MQQPLFFLDTRQLPWMEFESYQRKIKIREYLKVYQLYEVYIREG